MNGEKVEYYTDEENVAFGYSGVVEVDLDGEVIVEVGEIDTDLIVKNTTASAVYARTGRIVLADGKGYYLSDDAA